MDLRFDTSLVAGYKSAAQIARVLTEDWFARNMYCPICGENTIQRAEANSPVKDYVCQNCKSQYELKSKKETSCNFNRTVNDGVYRTMIERITALDNPSFFFLHYDKYEVNNLSSTIAKAFIAYFLSTQKVCLHIKFRVYFSIYTFIPVQSRQHERAHPARQMRGKLHIVHYPYS